MTRNLTLSALLLSLPAFAQVAPDMPASLEQHMLEVNAEWAHFDTDLADGMVDFATEADRIASHLHLVRSYLATHQPEGLGALQAARRMQLLDRLTAYADRGVFPQNHVLPYRNPIFIDPNGTACAVGQLMIESGHRDLAERIDGAMETGYLAEIIADDRFAAPVSDWAAAHGFTADELAWIQPGYPPTIPWMPLGGGTNGDVRALLTLPNGDLLVAGNFSEAGGAAHAHVAVWNGSSYTALGAGLGGDVTCAALLGNELYVGGSLLNGVHDLAMWNGSSWSFSTVMDGKLPVITALHVHNGDLTAAGEVMGFAGIDHVVKQRTAGQWEQLGDPFNAPVNALSSHDGLLIAGGGFTGPVGPTDPTYNYVAAYSGDWAQLADGLDAPVYVLLDADGDLYAGGMMYGNVVPRFGLAKLAPAAPAWERLLPNLANYMDIGTGGPTSIVHALTMHEGELYFGGSFLYFEMMLFGTNVARYTGEPDGVEVLAGILDGTVLSLGSHAGKLVMGGAFSGPLPHVASVDLSTGVAESDAIGALLIGPNPAVDRVFVEIPAALGQEYLVQFTDASGRMVQVDQQRTANGLLLHVASLAPGTYSLQVTGNGRSSTGRLVRQ